MEDKKLLEQIRQMTDSELARMKLHRYHPSDLGYAVAQLSNNEGSIYFGILDGINIKHPKDVLSRMEDAKFRAVRKEKLKIFREIGS